MKRIRVTVTEEYLLPDDWEITTQPDEQISCLRGDNRYFLPDLAWAERRLYPTTGKLNSEPQSAWVGVADDLQVFLMESVQISGAEFKEVE